MGAAFAYCTPIKVTVIVIFTYAPPGSRFPDVDSVNWSVGLRLGGKLDVPLTVVNLSNHRRSIRQLKAIRNAAIPGKTKANSGM